MIARRKFKSSCAAIKICLIFIIFCYTKFLLAPLLKNLYEHIDNFFIFFFIYHHTFKAIYCDFPTARKKSNTFVFIRVEYLNIDFNAKQYSKQSIFIELFKKIIFLG